MTDPQSLAASLRDLADHIGGFHSGLSREYLLRSAAALLESQAKDREIGESYLRHLQDKVERLEKVVEAARDYANEMADVTHRDVTKYVALVTSLAALNLRDVETRT